MDTNREAAAFNLADAETQTGNAKTESYALTVATIAVGFALLDVAAAIREQTKVIEYHAPRSPGVVTRA